MAKGRPRSGMKKIKQEPNTECNCLRDYPSTNPFGCRTCRYRFLSLLLKKEDTATYHRAGCEKCKIR